MDKTGYLESAMEWLLNHPEGEDDVEEENEEMPAEPEVPKVPLTPEEKAQKIIEMEELRIKKRAEREEREKQEQIEKEKRRVAEGKAVSKTRQQLDDQEIKKIAEDRKREKLETAKAKQRALDAIESDKRYLLSHTYLLRFIAHAISSYKDLTKFKDHLYWIWKKTRTKK